jgi:hypothetical protein
MKVDRVIFAVNSNPLYADFWNKFSPVWKKKFGITPTLIFLGTNEELQAAKLSTEFGEIIRVDPVPSVILNRGMDWSVTWAFMWAPCLFPDEVCMTSGIDQLPLSDMFFRMIEDVTDDAYVIGFSGAYTGDPNLHPSSHHVAMGSTFIEMYKLLPYWPAEVVRIFEERHKYPHLARSHYWGLDEAYSSDVLNEFEDQGRVVKLDMFHQKWAPNRIARGINNMRYHVGPLRDGHYSELHSPRPYRDYSGWIDKVIEFIMEGH